MEQFIQKHMPFIKSFENIAQKILIAGLILLINPVLAFSQTFSKTFDWDIHIEEEEHWIMNAREFNEEGDIVTIVGSFYLDEDGNPRTYYTWLILNNLGEIEWMDTSEAQWWQTTHLDFHIRDNKAITFQPFFIEQNICFFVEGENEGSMSPGLYSLIFKTELDLENKSFVGDTLTHIALDSCEQLFFIDRTFSDVAGNDYLLFDNESTVTRAGNDGVIDSVELVNPISNLPGSPVLFPSALECGETLCQYKVLDVLESKEQILLLKSIVSESEFVTNKLVLTDFGNEVLDEFEHPFSYLIDQNALNPIDLWGLHKSHEIQELGDRFVYSKNRAFHVGGSEDSLRLAVLNSEFEIEEERSFSNGGFSLFTSRVYPLEFQDLILVSHYADNLLNLTLFDTELNELGSKTYGSHNNILYPRRVNSLEDGHFLIAGWGSTANGNRAWVMKENVANIINFLGIESVENEEFFVHPNPTSGFVNISITKPDSNHKLSIYNTSGQLIKVLDSEGQREMRVSLEEFVRGVYFVHLNKGMYKKIIVL